jgi:hypothetical protein
MADLVWDVTNGVLRAESDTGRRILLRAFPESRHDRIAAPYGLWKSLIEYAAEDPSDAA